MLRSSSSRIARSLLVILIVTFAVTAMLSLAPGSVAGVILGENATPDQVAALNEKLGLNQPILVQYWNWLINALQGDLGNSAITGQSVTSAIIERIPVTLELALLAVSMALVIAVPLAIISATRPGSRTDRVINAFSSMFLSIPAFVAGPVLIYLFAVQFNLFPVNGWSRIEEDGLLLNLRSAFLPALAIALPEIASFHRLLRTDLITTLREDYIAAARAKGMTGSFVLVRHALRPSSFSLVTLFGINLGRAIGGAVIVESLFSLPGLGQLVVTSISARDITMATGVVVFTAVVYVVINTCIDFSYGFLDPRVRKGSTS
ncbi:MAG: ABC transporter permease [Actinomycetota bacterium]|nr:ABC transporter permease [Actinomycetota bacterium]